MTKKNYVSKKTKNQGLYFIRVVGGDLNYWNFDGLRSGRLLDCAKESRDAKRRVI